MANKNVITELINNPDITAEDRKKDHIELALNSRTSIDHIDQRFSYEPVLSGMPDTESFFKPFDFVGKKMMLPVWVSSMTGGTEMARTINFNLARACGEFGMGMGLGSCRQLLYDDTHLADFDVRSLIGDDYPLYANLGIAQVEQLLDEGAAGKIKELVNKLQADGLIIHINPLQEWFQPEGDQIKHSPLDTIKRLIDQMSTRLIVKEVGQGMGRASLEALMKLPLEAVDFAAMGGTNFSKIELSRNDNQQSVSALSLVGHSAGEMVNLVNDILSSSSHLPCQQIIVSGGITDFLDGYYHTQKLKVKSVYGQASALLKHARGDYSELQEFLVRQRSGLAMAHSFLKIK